MSTEQHQALLEQILHDIANDKVTLPTLPDVAAKIQKLIDDPNVSADQIISALSGDPAISVQIIKSANSAAFAGMPTVDNVREATSRLGYRQLHNLVVTITMSKMFHSKNQIINRHMKNVLEHSQQVAAVSYVLALRQPHLSPDQAMMAGLIHDIGALPLCLYLEKNSIPADTDMLETLARKCNGKIGAELLKKWNFSQEMIEVVAEHEDIHRTSGKAPHADYADVVTIANLQDRIRAKMTAWNNIAAVGRLGLSEEECKNFIELNADRIGLVESMLGMSPTTQPQTPVTAPPVAASTKIPPAHRKPEAVRTEKDGLLSRILKFFK